MFLKSETFQGMGIYNKKTGPTGRKNNKIQIPAEKGIHRTDT
jgi:hypothetical protein